MKKTKSANTEIDDLKFKLKVALEALHSIRKWLNITGVVKEDNIWNEHFVKANNKVLSAIKIIRDGNKPT